MPQREAEVIRVRGRGMLSRQRVREMRREKEGRERLALLRDRMTAISPLRRVANWWFAILRGGDC